MTNENTPLDISVIIPFKNQAKMTLVCVRSLLAYGPPLKEILLINNNSDEGELASIDEFIANHPTVTRKDYLHPFNYQKMNNWAVKQSSGKFIFFLNNDTELVEESVGVIETMHARAKQTDVGMVGCLLLYGDQKTIQHAGVFLKPGLQGDHLYVGQSYKKALNENGSEKFPYDITKPRQLTAVTGAAQLVERIKFDAVKGFDERFIICGGDVDLCIRLNKAGYQTWYESGGYIVHKESQSRYYKPVPYIDFYYSYKSYINGYDLKLGDPFLPKITEATK
jgi:GT2 family glycosyltransferase